MCKGWWDLPRETKKWFWPCNGFGGLPGEFPSVVLLPCRLMNVPVEAGLVVRKPYNYSQRSANPRCFLSKCKLWLMVMFQRRTWEWSLESGSWHSGLGKGFGEWIYFKMLNANKQHSSYMVWLATKTRSLFFQGSINKLFLYLESCLHLRHDIKH